LPDLLTTILGLASGKRGKVEVKEIYIDDVMQNPDQPREIFNEKTLEELAMSIAEFGVIQPIIVRQKGIKYELVVGERRLRACKMVGLDTIPAIVRRLTDDESLAFSLIENLQRDDLNPIEEAKVYLRLIKDLKLTQKEIGEKLGKNPHFISNMIKLLRLPNEVRKAVSHETITKGHAWALLKLKDKEAQIRILKEIEKKSLSVKQTEKLIEFEKELKKKEGKEEFVKIDEIKEKAQKIYESVKKMVSELIQSEDKIKLKKINRKDFVEIRILIPKKERKIKKEAMPEKSLPVQEVIEKEETKDQILPLSRVDEKITDEDNTQISQFGNEK
jgi:ParB family chromosome partitioning protein